MVINLTCSSHAQRGLQQCHDGLVVERSSSEQKEPVKHVATTNAVQAAVLSGNDDCTFCWQVECGTMLNVTGDCITSEG